jgi:UDP-hydrolysing UDP-N-acetyl-D-glucosamine 2-epimerase|tara:strand:+ start:8083 stop:9240 length:1158 start_codon:yes stop_codon:yes gene_type:complete
MKKIFVFSAGRSDYDRYLPILNKLHHSSRAAVYLVLSSAHYASKFGRTVNFIDKKFKIIKPKKINKLYKDKPSYLIKRFAEDLLFFSKSIEKYKPDILIVLGDRLEMLTAPIISIPNNIPIVHFYGGAVTEGAVDELIRHAITKLSHYHFVALDIYKKRLIQLGEESWRIKVSGMHSVNFLKLMNKIKINELSKIIGINLKEPYLLLTFHPATIEKNQTKRQISEILKAIKKTKINTVVTYPNADSGHNFIIRMLLKKLKNKKKYSIIKNCGSRVYSSLMKNCLAMIGNSSSGIVESASFGVPAINIGTRQDGKFKPKNIINCGYSWKDIYNKILKIQNKRITKNFKNLKNPYEGKVSLNEIISTILKLKKNDKLLRKKFINMEK